VCSTFTAGRNFRIPSGRRFGSSTLAMNDRRLMRKACTVMPSCERKATAGFRFPASSTQYDLPSVSYTIHQCNVTFTPQTQYTPQKTYHVHSWQISATRTTYFGCCVFSSEVQLSPTCYQILIRTSQHRVSIALDQH